MQKAMVSRESGMVEPFADHIGSFGQTITHVSWAQAEKRRREPSIQEDHGNSK